MFCAINTLATTTRANGVKNMIGTSKYFVIVDRRDSGSVADWVPAIAGNPRIDAVPKPLPHSSNGLDELSALEELYSMDAIREPHS